MKTSKIRNLISATMLSTGILFQVISPIITDEDSEQLHTCHQQSLINLEKKHPTIRLPFNINLMFSNNHIKNREKK